MPYSLFSHNNLQYSRSSTKKKWSLGLLGAAVVLVVVIVLASTYPSQEPIEESTPTTPTPASPSPSPTTTPIPPTEPPTTHPLTNPTGLLLVVTGEPRSNNTAESEVIHLEDPTMQCASYGSYPIEVSYATGGFVRGMPVICGGYCFGCTFARTSDCYTIGNTTAVAKLETRRDEAMSIVINDGRILWVTGGQNNPDGVMNSTEYASTMSVDIGPTLPVAMEEHCLLQLNASTFMFVGGLDVDSDRVSTTWFYNFELLTWTSGPSLIEGRNFHVCGMIKDSVTGKAIVVTTTGRGTVSRRLNSTELWTAEADTWMTGPALPHTGLLGATGTVSLDQKHLIVAGGYDKHYSEQFLIYKIQCFNLVCVWDKMAQELRVARAFHVAMLIPEDRANCTIQN